MGEYFYKHGEQIIEGMLLRHDEGDIEKVHACGVYSEDLGFSVGMLYIK